MCRIAAYVGPPAPLAALLYEPPHSLDVQAYRPREMVSGTVNVDGTGVAWWQTDDPEPLRYVTELPPWSDPNLPSLSRRLCGHTALATVRSATPGIPSGPGSVLPFLDAGVAATHNGYLGGFQDGVAATLLHALPPDLLTRLDTLTDSKLLFLLTLEALRAGADLGTAVQTAADSAARACLAAGFEASLNLVMARPGHIVALRCARGVAANTLYVRHDANVEDPAAWLASEPLDDGPWEPVSEDRLVELTPTRIRDRAAAVFGAP